MPPMRMHQSLALLAIVASSAATSACGKGGAGSDQAIPPIPASSDPAGKDIVEGAVIAAREKAGGIRLYKVTHVDDYPPPMGYEYHLIAYGPLSDSFENAAAMWRKREAKKVFDHLDVREVHFLPRDHRILFVEPLTDEERATYTNSVNSRGAPMPMPMLTASPSR